MAIDTYIWLNYIFRLFDIKGKMLSTIEKKVSYDWMILYMIGTIFILFVLKVFF